MSKYAAGTVEISSEFVMSFAETLDLSRTERRDLAEQYAYYTRARKTSRGRQIRSGAEASPA